MDYLDKHKRIFAFVTAFLVTAVLLLSGFFIVTHIEHECTGEDCTVCAELQECAATIRLITEAAGTGSIVIFAYILKNSYHLTRLDSICARFLWSA